MSLEEAKSLLLVYVEISLEVGRSTLASLELNAPTAEVLLQLLSVLFQSPLRIVEGEDDIPNIG